MVELPTGPNSFFDSLCAQHKISSRFSGSDHLLLSLSGGVDSVLTLHLLCHLRSLLGLKIAAVHFNHGLRADESEGDQFFCSDLCEKYSIPLQIVRLSFSSSANLQNEARILRRNFLKECQKENSQLWIVTGHHLNDCVESFLITLHQGRWDQRLFFLPVFDEKFQIFRPLVRISKDKIIQVCRSLGYHWREDSSNQSEKYLRNFYRHGFLAQEGAEILMDISHEFEHFHKEQAKLFASLMNQITVLTPENRLWKKAVSFWQAGQPISGFEIKKSLLQGFSCSRKAEFFYDFCRNFCPQTIDSLDMKRVAQLFSAFRTEPGVFILSGKKALSEQLVLLETARSYGVFNFL